MDSLREFFVSSSGLAPVRQGLGLGWLISALTGVAVLLGAKEARSDNCPGTVTNSSWHAGCAEAYPDKPFRRCTKTLNSNCDVIKVDCECVA